MGTAPREGSVEHWARTKPDAPGVIDGEHILRWGDWDRQANALAARLSELGLKAGDVVVARCGIRWEWAVLAAALSKLDCLILGLNWRLTPAESRYIMGNSKARAIVCDDADPSLIKPVLDELGVAIALTIDHPSPGFLDFHPLLEGESPELYSDQEAPLVIYTSGTTSLPKGVVPRTPAPGEEAELQAYLDEVASHRSQGPGDVMMITMPLHHAAGPWQVRFGIRYGNTMVFLRRFDPERALQMIDRWRVTFWSGVPTMYKRIAALPEDVLARYDVSSIRQLSVGAAPCPYALKLWILDHFGEVLSEGYGGTEFSMITSLPPHLQRSKGMSAGKVFNNVRVRIRDEDKSDLPVGEVGEIWVKTPVTIERYLNEPPLGPDVLDAEGFFRTGDCGRLDEEGYLYITDRVKDMIISGGVNIYPAEIEAAIIAHPAVQDVAVVGVPDEEFGESVKAFCEVRAGHSLDQAELLEFCRDRLASYKRPKSFEFVTELPRNTVGKILKRELRKPFWEGQERNV